jgi:hypothetical protein
MHSTYSDGGKDYRGVAEAYADTDHDFIFVTDHMHVADIEDMEGLPLLALNGVELDGSDGTGAYYHAVALGLSGDLPPGAEFEEMLAYARGQGAILVLAHPRWTGNSVEDALRHGFDGVEVYNDICRFLNGRGFSGHHWDCMLDDDPLTLGFSADDAHLNGNEQPNGGWIVISAPELTKESVLGAIRSGSYYMSRGPDFRSIRATADRISVETSPVREIRLASGRKPYCGWGNRVVGQGDDGLVSRAEFEVVEKHDYLRVEIEDETGRTAWTNVLLVA